MLIILLLILLTAVSIRCYSVVKENAYDGNVIGSYQVLTRSMTNTNREWQFITFYQNGTYRLFGSTQRGIEDVGGGTYEIMEAEIEVIALDGDDGNFHQALHLRDYLMIGDENGICCFRKYSPVPTAWSVSE